MDIRLMTIADYHDVYQLWISTPGMGLNDLDDSKDGIEKFLKRNPKTCFVACQDDQIIGAILAGNDGRRGYIYHTAVAVSFQRKGIGSKLVQAVLDAYDEQHIHKVALVVFERNENGNRFWQSQGFTIRNDLCYRNLALTSLTRIDT